MAGFQIATAQGVLTEKARQQADGSWVIEVEASPARRKPVGPPERILIGTGAAVTLSPPAGATMADVFLDDNSGVRYYDDGSTPTTTVTGNGGRIPAGGAAELTLENLATMKMIAETAQVAGNVLYYRPAP